MKEVIGFHGTKKENVSSIISDNFKVPRERKNDNHWLGHGVYFFKDYELAKWWAETKVRKHALKYGRLAFSSVIKATIKADKVVNLDIPYEMDLFLEFCLKKEKEFVEKGIILNFACSDELITEDELKLRKRCFWMDIFKGEGAVDVIIYTFKKEKPSYAASKDNIKYARELCLSYNETQICVTDSKNIINREEVKEDFSYDDEIV